MNFADLDALALDAAASAFGEVATIVPMHAPAGPNGGTAPDPSRQPLVDVNVIRSEWSERIAIGSQGMPTPSGHFRQGAGSLRHVASLAFAGLAWRPRAGDEVRYADDPERRFRIAEVQPDGGAGLHLVLTRIGS